MSPTGTEPKAVYEDDWIQNGRLRRCATRLARQPQQRHRRDYHTQFTYQGHLEQGGSPANGLYDFEFKMYDGLSGGSLVNSTNIVAVPVTNALFTVALDFGWSDFNSADRWLEIAVRPHSAPGTAVTLSPRQQLTPTPYAIFAEYVKWWSILDMPADFADGADNDSIYDAGPGLRLNTANRFSVDFFGSGTASTAARSDHDHLGATWIGNAGTGAGLAVYNLDVNGAGLHGESRTETGCGIGVRGISDSDGGVGVVGFANGVVDIQGLPRPLFANGGGVAGFANGSGSLKCGVYGEVTGSGYGVAGLALSENGTGGVLGDHVASTGISPGVKGQTASTSGYAVGVLGEVTSTDPGGFSAAVRGVNNGIGGSGIGVWGSQAGGGWGVLGTAASGQGVRGESTSGTGVLGYGVAAGVLGSTVSPTGVGVHAIGSGPTGTALAIEGGAIRVAGAGVGTSTPAFVHVVASATSLSTISNPLSNGNPNALLLVTPVSTADPPQARGAGVTYNTSLGQWQLFPTDPVGPFPAGQRFNILVIKP